jgi:hypothetical protein
MAQRSRQVADERRRLRGLRRALSGQERRVAERRITATLRRAMVYGSVMASFTVEDFSLNRLARLDTRDIDRRYKEFEDLIRLERD